MTTANCLSQTVCFSIDGGLWNQRVASVSYQVLVKHIMLEMQTNSRLPLIICLFSVAVIFFCFL
jgi:hypothetical protein